MRAKTSVYIATSVDGYIARETGDISWLAGDGDEQGDEDYGYQAFMDTVDTLVMGRNTYEKVLTFGGWPYDNKNVVVLSTAALKVPERLSGRVEVQSLAPQALVEHLSDRGVSHIYVDGGKTIQRFLGAGLIDEMTITRLPILIGSGIPLFGPLDRDVKLTHVSTRHFENGFVQSKYSLTTAR